MKLLRLEQKHFHSSFPNQKGLVVWLCGLSGSGKTTLSKLLEEKLITKGFFVFSLDGDLLRTGLNKDLAFTDLDRMENIRRAAEVAKILVERNIITICSFITPLEIHREQVRETLASRYFEIFVDCSIEICEQRDVKGLYKRARDNDVTNFTGVSGKFERPLKANLRLTTGNEPPLETLEKLYSAILPRITR